MKNSQQHLGNEANLATFSLSHDVIFLMVSPLLGRFLVSFNLQSAICGLQSAVCSLQSANVIHRQLGGLGDIAKMLGSPKGSLKFSSEYSLGGKCTKQQRTCMYIQFK